jgi:hypothetical protein
MRKPTWRWNKPVRWVDVMRVSLTIGHPGASNGPMRKILKDRIEPRDIRQMEGQGAETVESRSILEEGWDWG